MKNADRNNDPELNAEKPGEVREQPQPEQSGLSNREALGVLCLLFLVGCLGCWMFTVVIANGWAGNEDQLYYILLLVWGLICAMVLFLAVKSFARVVYHHSLATVELGGAAAVFALVVVGGLILVPHEPRALTVRLLAPGNSQVVSGKVRLLYRSADPEEGVNDKGDAHFTELPASLWNHKIGIEPIVEGYDQKRQDLVLKSDLLEVTLEEPKTMFSGWIVPSDAARAGTAFVRIDGDDTKIEVRTDGTFQQLVRGAAAIPRMITVCVNHRRRYYKVQNQIGSGIELRLRGEDGPC